MCLCYALTPRAPFRHTNAPRTSRQKKKHCRCKNLRNCLPACATYGQLCRTNQNRGFKTLAIIVRFRKLSIICSVPGSTLCALLQRFPAVSQDQDGAAWVGFEKADQEDWVPALCSRTATRKRALLPFSYMFLTPFI